MRPRHAARGRHRRPRRRWAAGAVVLALAAAGTAGWLARDGVPEAPTARAVAQEAPPPDATGPSDLPRIDERAIRDRWAIDVLERWDRARAKAYAAGSSAALRRLYVGGAGRSDVRLLSSYLRRGYRVAGMRMQLLAVHVVDRAGPRLTLRVTDRLAHAVAVGNGERVELPRDRAGTRLVRLARGVDGRWRVAEVRG